MYEEANYWSRLEHRVSRRWFMGTAMASGAAAAALGAVGCGSSRKGAATATLPASGGTSAAASSTSTTTTAATVVKGGTWQGFFQTDPTNFDPYPVVSTTALELAPYCYSGLIGLKAGPGINAGAYQAEPDLAESLPTVSADGLTYTVKLRQNAKWHPPISRPVTADDVVFSWQRYTGQIPGTPANPSSPQVAAYLDSVEKVDDLTVVFHLKHTRGDFLTGLNGWIVIMPKETGTAFNPAQRLVGSGPWLFDSYVAGSVIKFKRNPEWHFGPDAPYLDGVDMNIIPTYATRLSQYLSGHLDECDLLGSDLGRISDSLKGGKVIVVESNLPGSYISFDGQPDAANAPWRDVRVRHAISMACDRSAMLDAAYNLNEISKLGFKLDYLWNNNVPSLETNYWLDPKGQTHDKASDPTETAANQAYFKYSPSDAKKLLAAAGFPDGFKTQLHTTGSQYGDAFNILTQLLQQYLKDIGVQVGLVEEDYASVYVTHTARGQFSGLAHIPEGAGVNQFEAYYLPGGVRNNATVNDPVLSDMINKMLADHDPESARLDILNLQNYTNDKMYYVPMQLGAAGVFYGYSPQAHNGDVYRVNGFGAGGYAYPYYWKSA